MKNKSNRTKKSYTSSALLSGIGMINYKNHQFIEIPYEKYTKEKNMGYESLSSLEATEKFYRDEIEKERLKQQIARHKYDLERMQKDPSYDPLRKKLMGL